MVEIVKIGVTVLGKIVDYLAAPISHQFNYICCFNSNIKELEDKFEEFQTTRQGVQMGVERDERNVRVIAPNVEAWLTTANKVTTEVEGIIQDKAKVEEGCLNGWCPNLKLHYSLSRKAVKKTTVVVDLQKDGVQYTHSSYTPPPPCLETIPNKDFTGFESRRLNMEEIFKALKHDEINLIGVCGMGGVGKTTMVNEVAKRAKEVYHFEEVAMAVVSQEPNLTNVQACIADMLGLKLGCKRLVQNNKKVLVILDDIWEEFDLHAMGIPLEGANKNFKMLYTSRTRDLWHDVQTKKEIPLEFLSEGEAWQLFREKAGDLADARDLQPIAKKIVHECGRLPLALVLVGGALSKKRGRSAIKEMWEGMLDRLTCAINIHVDEGLYSRLELSYEYLECEEAKRLFLLCCLFKEDENIRIEDLARFGFGLSFFDGIHEMGKVRRQVLLIVDDLKSRYLLLDSKKKECVKVHDVVRNMGISIASRDKGALVRHSGLSEWPKTVTHEHCTAISVISEKIKELPKGLSYPNLEFLMFRSYTLEKLPPDFFVGMEKLKVLDLNNFHGILTFQPLRNLTTLALEGFCGVLDNVCVIGDILNLEILSFRRSKIKELPEEIGELNNLRLLDLEGTYYLNRIPRGVISRLVRLEELYIWNSGFENWEGEGEENANLREFESLSNLNTLEIYISDDGPIPRAPIFGELKMYKFFIGELSGNFTREEPYERVLSVCRSTPIPSYPFIALLRSSDCLILYWEGCNDLVRELLLRNGVGGLQQLKHLEISFCVTPECLVNTMNLFPILKYLCLYSLSYLREICRGPVPTGSFRELTKLIVANCGLLENLFELPIGGCFTQLKILTIRSCIMMKEVFRKQQREDVPDATKRIEFLKLETLELEDLPSLVGFCGGIDQIDFPKLECIRVEKCGLLENLFELPIGGCFAQLKILTIKSCNMMKEVFLKQQREEVPDATKRIEFPKLETLELEDLPSLVGFCGGIDQIDFPKLKCMDLKSLGKFKRLFHNNSNQSSNASQEDNFGFLSLFPQKVSLPNLEVLEIFELENLETLGHDLLSMSALSKLKEFSVHYCGKLLCVFSSQVEFPQLEKLELWSLPSLVSFCQGIDQIKLQVEFPQLKKLELRGLPSLVSFCRGIDQIKFPKLEYMLLISVGKIKRLINNNSNLSSNSEQKDNFGFLSLFPHKVSLPNLVDLEVTGLQNLERLGHGPLSVGSLSKLNIFLVRDCGKLLCVFPSQLLPILRDLQKLRVQWCNLLKVVFELEGVESNEPNQEILSPLEVVELLSLPKLKYISKRDPMGFKYIQTLEIYDCKSLDYIFAPTMTKSIPQLRRLTLQGCEMLSSIIAEKNGLGESSVDEVEFPKLDCLFLFDLPNLVSFFPKVNTSLAKSTDHLHSPMQCQPLFNEKVAIPSLENLKIRGLQNVSDLWCSELPTDSFSKVKKLKVRGCANLRNMFHPSMARRLVNLQKLVIDDCSKLEAVVDWEEGEVGQGGKLDKLFPQLIELEFFFLPILMRFCHFTHPIELPRVSKMDIMNCPSMDAFSLGQVSTPNLSFPGISWNGDLNKAIKLLQEREDDNMDIEEDSDDEDEDRADDEDEDVDKDENEDRNDGHMHEDKDL